MKPFAAALTVLSALSFSLAACSDSSPFSRLFRPAHTAPLPLPDPAALEQAALDAANQTRANLASPAPALAPHPRAASALNGFVESGFDEPFCVDPLFADLQIQQPQISDIASHLITGASQEVLLSALSEWPELSRTTYTHLAAKVFRQPDHRRTLCLLAILMRELPLLQLPLPRGAEHFACDTCRICNTTHGVTLTTRTQSTFFISCPHCKNVYNLLAADSTGHWRRANQFLEGIDKFSADPALEPEDRVLSIWSQVDERCRYQFDPERLNGADSWKLPRQTYDLTWGDCEDTSMLLADALISNGFDARVAIGRQKGQGHAWCVLRLEDRQYILESTAEGVDRLRRLPRLDDIALDYQADCQFDRENLYFNRFQQWTANYWSGTTWVKVRYPADPEPLSTVASTAP